MAKQTIGIGSSANDGTGDPLRTAMAKVNDNFNEVYSSYAMTGNLSVGNSTVNTVISNTGGLVSSNTLNSVVANSSIIRIANSSGTTTVLPTSITVGSNVTLSQSSYFVGNTVANAVINKTSVVISNSTSNATITPISFAAGISFVNTIAVAVGANVIVNSSAVFVGNSTVNTIATSSNFKVGANLTVNTSAIFVGNSTVNATISSSSINITSNTGFTLGNSTASSNGFTFLPNGIKMNWGWISANSSDGNATFSSAFSVNAYVVTATSNSAVATYQAAVIGANTTVALIRTANATSTNVYWTAIGS